MPIDVVKLDAEFFRGNDEEGKGKVIVSEAISLAKKLNMRIVAEGIETREQVDFLAENECDLIQGYYFAKPMPVEEFEVKMNENEQTLESEMKMDEKNRLENWQIVQWKIKSKGDVATIILIVW